jgi:AcrR family transcriptional regulator
MARISKEPEERKNELMDVAFEIFLEKGFDDTTINDIVKRVSVAQGLFYYYFSSKLEMLDAVLDRHIDNHMKLLSNIANNNELEFQKRFQLFVDTFFGYGIKNEQFAHKIHPDKNYIIHQKLIGKTIKHITPLLLQLINEGIQEKIFNIPCADEMLEILIPGMIDYVHRYYFCQKPEIVNFKMEAAEKIIRRMLGSPDDYVKLNLLRNTEKMDS